MDKIQVTVVLLSVCLTIGSASSVGDSCTSDSDCSSYGQYCLIYSNCDGKGTCSCKSSYTTVSTTCKDTKLIGDSCDGSSKCPDVSSCSSGKCVCNSGTTATSDKKYCYPSTYKVIGDTCTSGQTCYQVLGTTTTAAQTTTENTNCVITSGNTGTCQCANGRKQSYQQCLYYEYGEGCSTSGTLRTCNPNKAYQCTSGTCSCTSDHTYYSTKAECVYTSASTNVAEGQTCNEDSNTSSSKWCASGLTCTTCPSSSTKTCKSIVSGAAAISFSFVTVAAMLISFLL